MCFLLDLVTVCHLMSSTLSILFHFFLGGKAHQLTLSRQRRLRVDPMQGVLWTARSDARDRDRGQGWDGWCYHWRLV